MSFEAISKREDRISIRFSERERGRMKLGFLSISSTSLSESTLLGALENEFSGIFSIERESMK